jgi:hypothetical protein
MKRTLRPLAALAMLAVISAGCSNGSADSSSTGTTSNTGTAKSSGSSSTAASHSSTAASHSSTAASHSSTATPHEKAVRFAECMRENGYPDFPDPKASGEFSPFGISVSPAVWTKALGACKELQPPGSFSAILSPKQLSAGLKFAQCIRANGVKDFRIPSTVSLSSTRRKSHPPTGRVV